MRTVSAVLVVVLAACGSPAEVPAPADVGGQGPGDVGSPPAGPDASLACGVAQAPCVGATLAEAAATCCSGACGPRYTDGGTVGEGFCCVHARMPCTFGLDCCTGVCAGFASSGSCAESQIGGRCATDLDCYRARCHYGFCREFPDAGI